MMKYFSSKHLPKRIAFAILFSALFAVTGTGLPDIYYKYFDKTTYYVIEQPISTDKKIYKPCDDVKVTIKRNSLIDTTGSSVVDLLLIREDNITEKITSLNRSMAIPKGERTLVVSWSLPCTLADGKYYWQAVVRYNVRGIEKNYSYFSDTFLVSQLGISQETEDVIDQKIEEAQ